MNQVIHHKGEVPIEASGQRFDQVVAQLFPDFSRARLQIWIKEGKITLQGAQVKPKSKVLGGELVELQAELESQGEWLAEPIPLNIVFEDDSLLVINKPAGLVVHPAPGNYQGTLLNGLLHYLPSQSQIPRAGIVHRLDKDTTGLMVVAKTLQAQTQLVEQLQARSVSRGYVALVLGECHGQGTVNEPIGRDPKNRKKMATHNSESGTAKEAITHYSLIESLNPFSLLQLKLETGRTHQIRVHMAALGFPLVGDPLYGRKLPKNLERSLRSPEPVLGFDRQALHAQTLSLVHPNSKVTCSWEAEIPADMQALIQAAKEGVSEG